MFLLQLFVVLPKVPSSNLPIIALCRPASELLCVIAPTDPDETDASDELNEDAQAPMRATPTDIVAASTAQPVVVKQRCAIMPVCRAPTKCCFLTIFGCSSQS